MFAKFIHLRCATIYDGEIKLYVLLKWTGEGESEIILSSMYLVHTRDLGHPWKLII